MKWIRALDLDRWADTTGARTALSELVSALVRASASDMRSYRFPTGDSAQIPGYDGRLTATGAPPYVPDGDSVWEFGTNEDFLRKANEDFKQRTGTPKGVVRSETTFVFVTPRTWADRERSVQEWCDEKRRNSDWKSVQVIDGVALEAWLEQHEAVAARVARLIVNVVPKTGARSTEEFWDEYSARFKPDLTEEVLLCERSEQATELLGQLSGVPQDVIVRADSPDEAIAFVVAAIRKADADVRKFLESRTLVLDTEDAARSVNRRSKQIFVVRGTAVQLGGVLARNNLAVVPMGRDAPRRSGVVVLNRPSTQALRDAIATMGVSEEQAYQLARTCGRSVTVLARRIPRGDAGKPPWADGTRTLIPALLAGGWRSDSPQDRAIVSLLAGGDDYSRFESSLHPLERLQDPPVDLEGGVWKVRAPVDAFVHLAYLIGRIDLNRLRDAATAVFSEYDPSLDLPDAERPFSALKGKELQHSEWLREGLATTLLLMAVLHEEAGLAGGLDAELFVEELVRALPGLNRDPRLISSLGNQLPLLMEAAPRPLLTALEQLLGGDGAAASMFREGGLLGGRSPHTSILWALETMAWDPQYLPRVAAILARFAKVDPGGTLHNRPINSLREVFLPWHPGTNATLVQRMAVLDQLISQEPAVGWNLVVSLLPEHHDTAHPTAKPRYREAGESNREELTWGLVFEGNRQVVERALRLVQDDTGRWQTIIAEMHKFELSLRQRTYELLEGVAARSVGRDRVVLWEVLQKEVNRHRAFGDADWALKDPELRRLDSILASLAPGDQALQVAWLFNEHFPSVAPREDASRRDAVIDAREEAVQRIWSAGGANALLGLAENVQFPQFVAISARGVLGELADYVSLIEGALGHGDRLDTFALALSGEAEERFGADWHAKVLVLAQQSRWTAEQLTVLLLGWRDKPATWEVVEKLGRVVAEGYWRRKVAWPFVGLEPQAVEAGARRYLSVGRAIAAMDAIHRDTQRVPVSLIFDVLDGIVPELGGSGAKPDSMLLHYLGETFEELGNRADAPRLEVARREYMMLPLLGYRNRTLTLHMVLAEDPAFFVSVLCDVYRPKGGERLEPTADQRARAGLGFRLLNSFRVVPGLVDGVLDGVRLRDWTREVRRLASEADRASIGDQHVGHVLAHSPVDPEDLAWPHGIVRSLIEELASNEVERGIRIERHNMRGVVTKAAFEGGAKELKLAEEARHWARAAQRWPRTAGMLLELAESWEAQAVREDERARLDQMRYD